MIDLEQIRTVLQGISTVAALVKLRRETLKKEREPTQLEIQSQTDSVLNRIATPQGFDVMQASIKQSTLDAIGDVIERARERFEGALRDPANNKQARDAEEQIAKSTICGELKRIRRLNRDMLPPEYEDIWQEFTCA